MKNKNEPDDLAKEQIRLKPLFGLCSFYHIPNDNSIKEGKMSKRDEFVTTILGRIMDQVSLTPEQLNAVQIILDETASEYEIESRNTNIIPSESFIPEYYGLYIAWKKIAGRTKGTLKVYNRYLVDFFLHKPVPIEQMDSALMIRYLYDLQKRTNIGNRTLNQVRIIINTFLQWAANEGYISKNFCGNIDTIKHVEKPRQPLTEEEIVVLRDACETYRERAIIDTFLSTGIRIGELSTLNWADIDMDRKEMQVFGKGSKYRTVLFDSTTKISLLKYRMVCPVATPHVFQQDVAPYGRLHKGSVSNIIGKIDRRAQMDAHVSAHILRHTFATHALARGMSLEKLKILLGHENYSTTLIYADVDMSHVKYEYTKCFGA